jgi:hypothetical protein
MSEGYLQTGLATIFLALINKRIRDFSSVHTNVLSTSIQGLDWIYWSLLLLFKVCYKNFFSREKIRPKKYCFLNFNINIVIRRDIICLN